MKGLLMKDFYFAMQQKRLFLIILFMFGVFYISKGAESAPFVISYTTLMGGMFVLTSIGYDDFENSSCYIMTLPITRKDYVLEKYLFGMLGVFSFWLFPTAVYVFLKMEMISEVLTIAGMSLAVVTCFEMLMIPVQLKFGGEKGRMALIGVIVVGMLLLHLIKEIGTWLMGSSEAAKQMIENVIYELENGSVWMLGIGIVILLILETIISYRISLNVITKREY